MKNNKSLLSRIGKVIILCSVIFGMSFGYIQKAHADYYSPWLIVSVSGVKEENILYNGFKPLIHLYQEVRYRRTYTDKAGRTKYQYKTEKRNLGLKSPYN